MHLGEWYSCFVVHLDETVEDESHKVVGRLECDIEGVVAYALYRGEYRFVVGMCWSVASVARAALIGTQSLDHRAAVSGEVDLRQDTNLALGAILDKCDVLLARVVAVAGVACVVLVENRRRHNCSILLVPPIAIGLRNLTACA